MVDKAQTEMNPSADGWLFHLTFKKQLYTDEIK